MAFKFAEYKHMWSAILEAYHELKSKPKTSAKLEEAL